MNLPNLLSLATPTIGKLNDVVYPFTSSHTPDTPFLVRFPGKAFNSAYQFKADWPLVSWRRGLVIHPTFWLKHLESKDSIRVVYDPRRGSFRIK